MTAIKEITLLYNLREHFPTSEEIHPDISADWDIPETIELLANCIANLGFSVKKRNYDDSTIEYLTNYKGLVFNICEMVGGSYREALVPSLCELLNTNYIFSEPDVMLKTLDKNICNFLVTQMGINVPKWSFVKNVEQLNKIEFNNFPYILKLSHEGSGIGISDKSIVENYSSLIENSQEMFKAFKRPIIVQEYIEGVELTIGVIGANDNPEPLGLIEVLLHNSKVYGISQKENSSTEATYRLFENEKAINKIEKDSKIIYSLLGCQDAARLDFRLQEGTGIPYFIEINPLPHLHPIIGDFCRSAKAVGMSYPKLIGKIISNATSRIIQ